MVDLEGMDPLYQQVAEAVRDRIRSGDLAVGRAVPSISELAEMYRVGRNTAVRALDLLKADGTVTAVPGRGTFVARVPPAISR